LFGHHSRDFDAALFGVSKVSLERRLKVGQVFFRRERVKLRAQFGQAAFLLTQPFFVRVGFLFVVHGVLRLGELSA
jgi:hypothetical protein